jgi:hypothetical protein
MSAPAEIARRFTIAMVRNGPMPVSRFLRGSTHHTSRGCVASSQKCEQEQAKANEEQNMYGVTDRVEAQDPEQPHSKQSERDFEQHVRLRSAAGCNERCLVALMGGRRRVQAVDGDREQMLRAVARLAVQAARSGTSPGGNER